MAGTDAMIHNVLTTNVNEDLIVSSDSTGRTIRIRLTPEQTRDIERMEREGIIKPANKDDINPDIDYKFESVSDLGRQLFGAVFEFYLNEPFSPPKQNAPTGDMKISLEIEEF